MSVMTAPPSSKAEIVDVGFAHKGLVERLSPGGRYIDAQTDVDSPWVPFGENAAIKHLAFDVRQNLFSNILWVKGPGVIGTHLHRGTITMVCLEGSVRYLEYDWVASPGGLILEVPGESHTLVTDDPEGCKLFGWITVPYGLKGNGHCMYAFNGSGLNVLGQRVQSLRNLSEQDFVDHDGHFLQIDVEFKRIVS